MKFNGRDISSFWSAKALKFDTSYYTSFERQEVTYRGFLASYLEVPTIRKIAVDILVKDRDKQLLDKTIQEMAEWFVLSGEAKLFSDRNTKQYYLARCTNITNPEFKGHAATFTVEFTCSDYRPYNFITNQPIGDSSTILSNFTFDGKHCLNNMHCLFVLDNATFIPKVNRNVYEVSGRSGTISYNSQQQVLEERTITGTLYFLHTDGSTKLMTPQQIDQRAHEVASWLVGAGRKPITFDFNTGLAVDAEFCEQSDISYNKWANGSVSLKITCQPYFYESTAKTKSDTLSVGAGSWVNLGLTDIISAVGFTTPVTITVSPSASVSDLRIGYYDETNTLKTLRFYDSGFSLESGQTLTINSPSYDAAIGSTNALKFIKSGDFPVVTPKGTKRIRFYSNAAVTLTVSVSMNVRWL